MERILIHAIATAAEQYGFEKGIAIGRRKGLRNNQRVADAYEELRKAIACWDEYQKKEKGN